VLTKRTISCTYGTTRIALFMASMPLEPLLMGSFDSRLIREHKMTLARSGKESTELTFDFILCYTMYIAQIFPFINIYLK